MDYDVPAVSCPGDPDLICYNVSKYCIVGKSLHPMQRDPLVLEVPRELSGARSFFDALSEQSNNSNETCNKSRPRFDHLITCAGFDGLLCKRNKDLVGSPPWVHWELSGLILILVLAACCCQGSKLFYSSREGKKTVKSNRARQIREYETGLVKTLIPRIATPRYQFSGVRPIPPRKHISLKFEELGLLLNTNQRSVLDGVTGEIAASSMVAIMGPSGAGKTTLLNVLTGKAYYGTPTGTIWINGVEGQVSQFRKVMGFVPQDDTVYPTLTVREQISYSARLRNPVGTSRKRLASIVDDVLAVMQMIHIQNSIVGSVEERGISGGQRKRVNIGLELAACPTLLFLDEPTSGLDATSSVEIIGSLQQLSKLGMTVAMVIHQPRYSLFEMFDSAILLGVGGRTVYQGPSSVAQSYFEFIGYHKPANDNPADWFMDIISGNVLNERSPGMTPAALFDLWNENKHKFASTASAKVTKPSATTRDVEEERTKSQILAALDAEWHKIDCNGDGKLDRDELRSLLRNCSGDPPCDDVFEKLWERMDGDDGFVKRDAWNQFFVSLTKSVANRDSEEGSSDDSESTEESESDIESPGRMGILERQRPGVFTQLIVNIDRSSVMFWRRLTSQILSFALICSAGLIHGLLSNGKARFTSVQFPFAVMFGQTIFSVLVAVSALNVFGNDLELFWRESSAGINRFAFYTGRILVDIFIVGIDAILFVACWYVSSLAEGEVFFAYFIPWLLVALCSSAFGYVTSTIVPPQNATLAVSMVVAVLAMLFAQPNQMIGIKMSPLLWPTRASYLPWSTALTYLRVCEHAGGPDNLSITSRTLYAAYLDFASIGGENFYQCCVGALVRLWVFLLVAGYIGLVFRNKEKQV